MQHIYEYVATYQPHPLFFPLYLIFPLSNPSNCTVGSDSYISQWSSNTPHVFLSLPVQDVLLYIILNFDCHVTCVGVCQSGQYFTNVTPLYIQPSEIATFHHRTGFRVTKLCTLSGGSLELFRLHNEYNEMRYLWF